MANEEQFDCSFEIFANKAVWGNIEGNLDNQTDLKNALDAKADDTEIIEIDGRLDIIEATIPNLVPNTRTINEKALSSNITLNYSDVGALASTTTINDLTTSTQQDALNSGANSTNIGQITTNTNSISAINGKIPSQASTTNQLADKSFVNSSVATNTANFIGTFNSVAELEAYSGTLTNNDYAFVISVDTYGNTVYNRYKYVSSSQEWLFEYALNNSSFTSNQWASINSGITSNDVTLIGTALQPNDNITQLTNNAGYITGITSSDVTTALGYIPYNSSNPNGYQANVIETIQVNGVAETVTAKTVNITSLADKSLSNLNSTGQAIIDGKSDTSLSNLSTDGEGRLHALKGYLEDGTLYSDTTLYNDVYKYAHSTFDLSKFTVVGSPSVSANGIVSGFSTSNYLTKSSAIPISSTGEFRITYDFDGSSYTDYQYFLDFYYSNNEIVMRRGANADNGMTLIIFVGGTAVVNQSNYDGLSYCRGYIEYKNGVYTWVDNGRTQTVTSASKLSQGDYTITLGARTVNGSAEQALVNGQIDLKQFSITVDGVEVFSGNKTGIETIKADDYTVVGTPTISADGVASEFSGSNFVRTGDVIDTSKPFKLHIKFNTLQGSSALETILSLVASGQTQYELRKDSNGSTLIIVYADSATTRSVVQINSVFADNNKYDVIIDSDGTNIKTYIGENGATPQLISTITPYIVTVLYVNLGISYLVSNPFAGSIDLNSFKIYVDGNLVYQPCLKIPYTESSTGSKIVDAAYQDRVIDCYEQEGSALYYTIDEDNKKVALPMGEIYGFVQKNKISNNFTVIQGYDATATQTLKHVNGVLQWVTD